MWSAVNDPLVLPDNNLRLRLVQFLEDLLTVRAALTSLATADKLAHLRGVVIPRLCHPDTISVLGPFDNPADAGVAAAEAEPQNGKHFGFSKFHIYVLELDRAVARWGCATNVGMSGFEAANKDVVTIARHCLAARGEFIFRLAKLASVRYFFRFSLDALLDPAAAPRPYEPSVRPQNVLATFPRKQGTVLDSEPHFALLVRLLEEVGHLAVELSVIALYGPVAVRGQGVCMVPNRTLSALFNFQSRNTCGAHNVFPRARRNE
jgi:hypothetical protein